MIKIQPFKAPIAEIAAPAETIVLADVFQARIYDFRFMPWIK